jgi:predicted phosphoribosyltransferase
VAAPESLERLRDDADELVVVSTPFDFIAVGRWYRDFAQTSDEEVIELLDEARRRGDLPS